MQAGAKEKTSALSGNWVEILYFPTADSRGRTQTVFSLRACPDFIWPLLTLRNSILTFNASRYTLCVMIRSFKDSETEKIFHRTFSGKLPNDIQQIAFRKLRMLNRAQSLHDIRVPPANRLEKLTGKRKGLYSIRINDQWRVCFKWHHGDAFEMEITDYH